MKSTARNCPECGGTGRCSYAPGKCYFCRGKKKVNSDFVKWMRAKEKYVNGVHDKIEANIQTLRQELIDECVSGWEYANPKPRKFPAED